MPRNTREKIIDAGMTLFSNHGFAAVTTKEIAKAAEISEVTLYRHFDSKRGLFNAIIKEHMMNFGIAEYIQSLSTYDVRRDLSEIAFMMIKTYEKNRDLHRMVIKDKTFQSEGRKHSKRIENKDFDALREFFFTLKEKDLVKDDPKKLMKLFMSNIHGFVMHNYILPEETDKLSPDQLDYFEWLITKIIDIILM